MHLLPRRVAPFAFRYQGDGAIPCQYIDTTRKAIDCTTTSPLTVLANVNSRSRSLYAVARPSVCRLSVVGNARAPYSGGSNFPQYFYGIWYPSHPLTSTENFTEIVPGEPLRGVAKHSDLGHIDGYISETVQDRT